MILTGKKGPTRLQLNKLLGALTKNKIRNRAKAHFKAETIETLCVDTKCAIVSIFSASLLPKFQLFAFCYVICDQSIKHLDNENI